MFDSLRIVQLGSARAAAVCTRMYAQLGATVEVIDAPGEAQENQTDAATLLDDYLDLHKRHRDAAAMIEALRSSDLIVLGDTPARLAELALLPDDLETAGIDGALVYVTAYGLSGPQANDPACDLTLLCASGIARVLSGQVDDANEAPVRAVGDQSAFIGGLAAACAGMHLLLHKDRRPSPNAALSYADVSVHEALATLDIQRLTLAGLGQADRPRIRHGDGNGSTVTILPCADGYVAISPREDHQWRSWLEVMDAPAWGGEARFAKKTDRAANFDDLHALMSQWSRTRDKRAIARAAQAAHVPSFALGSPGEQLHSEQLAGRGFFSEATVRGKTVKLPGLPFGIETFAASGPREQTQAAVNTLPLAGVRVLDFSWVIAGPTTTRYLAAMGAEVIKVEAPGRGDPGRSSELHTVLGQAKRAITLDLKSTAGRELAIALVRQSDVLIENFATGVMDRLGLGATAMRAIKPDLIYLSASGLGRSGPESTAVAYGTLLQSYAGFAALNGHPQRPPRIGMAWLDPMCALKLAFIVAACVWRRARDGSGARIDFSMVEAMLWTMAAPLLEVQTGREPAACGNRSETCSPHEIYKAAGDDAWIAIAVRTMDEWRSLCAIVPELGPFKDLNLDGRVAQQMPIDAILADWCASADAQSLHARLLDAQIPASPVFGPSDLLASAHLQARGFWDPVPGGQLPGMPWRFPGPGGFDRQQGPAPALGADNEWVSREVLGRSESEYEALCAQGAFGAEK